MKRSIFHTSFCGSSLMACMISKSLETYSEPDWLYNLEYLELEDTKHYCNKFYKDNSIIKYPSFYTYLSALVKDKQVFLYRNLRKHLSKMEEASAVFDCLRGHNVTIRCLHPSLEKINKANILSLKKAKDVIIFNWLNIFLYMKTNKDVLFIECDSFLDSKQKTMQRVADHFEIDYKPVEINFDVKACGFHNHSNDPINLSLKDNKEAPVFKENKFKDSEDCLETIDKIKELYPELVKYI